MLQCSFFHQKTKLRNSDFKFGSLASQKNLIFHLHTSFVSKRRACNITAKRIEFNRKILTSLRILNGLKLGTKRHSVTGKLRMLDNEPSRTYFLTSFTTLNCSAQILSLQPICEHVSNNVLVEIRLCYELIEITVRKSSLIHTNTRRAYVVIVCSFRLWETSNEVC